MVVWMRGGVVAVAVLVGALGACDRRPSDAQLEAWRAEAVAADGEATRAAAGLNAAVPADSWSLWLGGQIEGGAWRNLGWSEVERLAQAHVKTTSPQNPADPTARIDFRGVPVSTLIDLAKPDPSVTEITFVAQDAFRSTISLEDARRWPILLAIEADGKPIPRSSGGPVFLIFPHSDFPESREKYPDRYWCFYVTHVVFGTEETSLNVNGRGLDVAQLEALPQADLETKVSYKVHWPDAAVRLRGPRLHDVLAAAGAAPLPGQKVLVRGMAPIQRDPAEPIVFAAEDLERCGVILATRWGSAAEPITAKLGGPVTVALAPACAATYGAKHWVTFVTSVEVVP
jgi:hypothetical protein